MLYKLLLGIHVIVCFALILVVLLQSSKGGGLAGAFGGGGGGQTMFGGQETATFLSKATTYLAVVFMVLSLVLALLSGDRGGSTESVIRNAAQSQINSGIPQGQDIGNVLESLDSIPAAVDTTGAGQ